MPDTALNPARSEPNSVHLFPEQDQIQNKKQVFKKPTIPPFRVEPEPLLFKNGFHLSSFTIASIIFAVMLLIGGIYLYTVLNDDTSVDATVDQTTMVKQSEQVQSPGNSRSTTTTHQPMQHATTTITPTKIEKVDNSIISHESRLEKEMTLRKKAEEEFNLKVQ
jgi:hypothetical protein